MVAVSSSLAAWNRSAGLHNGHATRAASLPSHERTMPVPGAPSSSTLSRVEREALVAAVRTAPPLPSTLLREPAVAALADSARRALARGTGRRPEDVDVDARALPGSGGRVLVFREAGGRQVSLPAATALSSTEAAGIGAALADLNVIAGLGLGFRVVPGVFNAGTMATASRLVDRDRLVGHLRAGASAPVGGAAFVWELAGGRPRPVGPALSLAVPFISTERDPQVGDKVELSIPGYVTVFAAVKRGERNDADVGWLGVVWHQGLLGEGPGPTVNAKLVVGHPALAAPLAPIVGGANAALSPIMARLHALRPRPVAHDEA